MRRSIATWARRLGSRLLLAGLAGSAGVASAVTVTSVSPQGEVARVQQATVKFSEPVVPFGDLRLPDP